VKTEWTETQEEHLRDGKGERKVTHSQDHLNKKLMCIHVLDNWLKQDGQTDYETRQKQKVLQLMQNM
jgi:hypothetical protein